jgi:hypothetical protein
MRRKIKLISALIILLFLTGCDNSSNSDQLDPNKVCGEVEEYYLSNIMKMQPGTDIDNNKNIKCMTDALMKCKGTSLSITGGNEKELYSIIGKQGDGCVVSLQQNDRYIECNFLNRQTQFIKEKSAMVAEEWATSSFYWYVMRFKLDADDFEEGETTIEFKEDDENIDLIQCQRKTVSADNIPKVEIVGEIPFTTAEETFNKLIDKNHFPDGFYGFGANYYYSLNGKLMKQHGDFSKDNRYHAPTLIYSSKKDTYLNCNEYNNLTYCWNKIRESPKLTSAEGYDLSISHKEILYFKDNLKNIEYRGRRSYYGKPCHEFKFILDENDIGELQEDLVVCNDYFTGFCSKSDDFNRFEYTFCLNTEAGFIESFNRTKYQINEGTIIDQNDIIQQLWKYDPTAVSEENFIPPIDFIIEDIECSGTKINVKVKFINDISKTTFVHLYLGNVNGLQYRHNKQFLSSIFQKNIEIKGKKGSEKEITIDISNKEKFSKWNVPYSIIFCTPENKCSAAYMYGPTPSETDDSFICENTLTEFISEVKIKSPQMAEVFYKDR